LVLASCAALALAYPALAADPPAQPAIDPAALQALDRMGAALRSHMTFALTADVTNEDVLDSGQKLQYDGKLEVRAHRPDRFVISSASDTRTRNFYYDGKAVTVYSPKLAMYASFPAPPTIAATLTKANEDYGIELPLADLFSWGIDKSLVSRIQSGFFVRPEHIDGKVCNHYAFRQPQVDWQIWIADDASALPCKIVITGRDDPSMPQYSAVLRWSFPATIAETDFTFTPPAGTHRIAFAGDAAPTAGKAKP
jgi:hypothetical protein